MTELLLLTSPPASGKTYWIKKFADEFRGEILVISPLRALADECQRNWGKRIMVMTPEEWLSKKYHAPVVIFDEFHLLYYWGDSFRPVLWEVFFSSSVDTELMIGLTATLSRELRDEIQNFSCHFDEIIWIDCGNQVLKWKPARYICPGRDLLYKSIIHLPPEKTTLLFCQYREEVLAWKLRLENAGYQVWSCLGGEAKEFGQRVNSESPPDFIVATTVLSHGVNLPTIKRVFLLYPVRNIDFWIQMIARGGRRGESFQVFALEPPHGLRWSKGKNLFWSGTLLLKISFSILLDQLEQCFLKE
jgi:superfamily II DNA or RNA helicase